MQNKSVSGETQVSTPQTIGKQLGIHAGGKMQISMGFGQLKSTRPAVPANFDPATLLNHDKT